MLKIPTKYLTRRPSAQSQWLPDERGGKVYINVSKVARELELDPSYLSYIVRGLRTPSLKTAMRLAKALNLTTEKLYELIQLKRVTI